MNRTVGIVITAASLALVALVLVRGQRPVEPPRSPLVARGAVSLRVAPSQGMLVQGGSGEVFLDISFTAPKPRTQVRRLPLNIGLVIDRSGSMAGEKLAHARAAAVQLVNELQDGDRIALVTYGSDVTVLASSTEISRSTRDALLSAIATITDRGGTFLSGGLERGRDEVLAHGREGFLNRVILISDGQANEGITTPAGLTGLARSTVTQGVNVTTMGVGLDFNEEVMTGMAEHGGGHYYFIQDSSSLARFFSEELNTMASVVGKAAELHLTLDPGVELLEVYGHTYERRGQVVVVRLPDLFGGQERKVMCKVRVPTTREGKVSVGQVELAYVAAGSGRAEKVGGATLVAITTDAAAAERSQDREVLGKAEQVQAAATIHEAMKAYAGGDVTRSRALLGAQIRRTQTANQRIRSKELDDLVGVMGTQIDGTAAAPASEAGRSLIKSGKYRAYKLAK